MDAPSSTQRRVATRLTSIYGDFKHHNKSNPLDELIFILGSTRTPENSYLATFKALKKKFPTFRDLTTADVDSIAEPLRTGGMHRQKAQLLHDIIESVIARFGKLSLSPLHTMDDAGCEAFLTSLPGVGKKIARCVMMYSLHREVFPVDTHCWRICKRLGWTKTRSASVKPTPKEMDELQEFIEPKLRFSLHVNLISHGRKCCTALQARCDRCILVSLCPKIGVTVSPPKVTEPLGSEGHGAV